MEKLLLLINAALLVQALEGTKFPNSEEVLEYLNGMKVPDIEAELVHKETEMKYKMTNVTIGELHEKVTDGSYDIGETDIKISFFMPHGFAHGYMEANFSTAGQNNGFLYKTKGNFTAKATNSWINITVLMPKLGSDKFSLIMTRCKGSYEILTMEYDAENIKNEQDRIAMNQWLSEAMHEPIKELSCIAMRSDVAKGSSSVTVQGIVGEILKNSFLG